MMAIRYTKTLLQSDIDDISAEDLQWLVQALITQADKGRSHAPDVAPDFSARTTKIKCNLLINKIYRIIFLKKRRSQENHYPKKSLPLSGLIKP